VTSDCAIAFDHVGCASRLATLRRCVKCGYRKHPSDFYVCPSTRDGLRLDCKACNNATRKANYHARRALVRTIALFGGAT